MIELKISFLYGIAGMGATVEISASNDRMIDLTAIVTLAGTHKITITPDDAFALGQALIREASTITGDAMENTER